MEKTHHRLDSSRPPDVLERTLVERARGGDLEALETLIEGCRRALFDYVYRMVTHRQDAEDICQEVQLTACESVRGFRGASRFKTWLFSIATHRCLDHLRRKVRWRREAQLNAELACRADWFRMTQVKSILARPDVSFEIREHIAFCFSCVSRSLEPESAAVLMLREVAGLTNQEAAEAVGLSEPQLRHRLSAARRDMQQSFDGLCQLVNKTGACWQCRGLRELAPPANRGEPPELVPLNTDAAAAPDERLDARIRIVREANLDGGASRVLHDDFFAAVDRDEEALGG